MKKEMIIALSCIIALTLFGCSKESASPDRLASELRIEMDSLIVGTWRYYKDIPEMPAYKTWSITFNKDGTYTTEGDKDSDLGVSHAETWGNGTYTISQDELILEMIRAGSVNTRARQIQIKADGGITQLTFLKDDRSEAAVTYVSAKVGAGGEADNYYTIFEKQN